MFRRRRTINLRKGWEVEVRLHVPYEVVPADTDEPVKAVLALVTGVLAKFHITAYVAKNVAPPEGVEDATQADSDNP